MEKIIKMADKLKLEMEGEIEKINEQCKLEIKKIRDKYNLMKKEVKKKYKKLLPKKSKNKRKTVPKTLKNLVWDKNIGKEKGIGLCYCCNRNIDSKNFEAGHIISVKNGGKTNIDNLKPICSCCNKSMGTQNLEEFKNKYMKVDNIPKRSKPVCWNDLCSNVLQSKTSYNPFFNDNSDNLMF